MNKNLLIASIIVIAVVASGVYIASNGLDDSDSGTAIIDVKSSAGGVITGSGEYSNGDRVNLAVITQYGYDFLGWYENDKLLSTDKQYSFKAAGNKTVIAKHSILHDASFSIDESSSKAPTTLKLKSIYNVEVKTRSWNITDALTGTSIYSNSGSNNSLDSISYNITNGRALLISQTITYTDGYKTTKTQTAVVDETVKKHFEWNYQQQAWHSILTQWIWNNKSASWDLSLSFEKYYDYSTTSRNYDRTTTNFQKYITVNDPYIQSLAKSLKDFTSDMSALERANCVLKFVQSIPYIYDINNKGVNEYWNYPYETLWDMKGDCDDHAILYASLMKAMGYKVAILLLPGHMAVGLDVSGASGTYYTVGGVKYYYCEATALVGGSWINEYNVGQIPSGYSSASVYVL